MKFSANLGFLWQELELTEAIDAAKAAGFDAVECHWPYQSQASEVAETLKETGLTMRGLNTQRGNVSDGENGVAAIPGRETQARQFIDQALDYAEIIGCKNIHVMAGFTDKSQRARSTFADNLAYACEKAATRGQTILIEPLNHRDAPSYHISTLDEGLSVITDVSASNLKLMFDCYHLQIMGGDLIQQFERSLEQIGHIQFAAVPDRGEPDAGEIDYGWLLPNMIQRGYNGYFGAEYKPRSTTDDGLGWLKQFNKDAQQPHN